MAAGPQGDMMLAHIIGKLYAAEETLRNVEDQLTTGRSRAATDPLMAWKVKHGRIAVLAALYCTRFIRRTRDGQRVRQGTQGQNDIGNYADWSAMSESNIAARA
ncbi:hypothetical protein B0A48_12012 [Cryoendolithus antarcticus]|uniref:Uncharacterized protein n=1 Tax=Cryoendolithus antarcticus TaxID=1507870 RepID=A0A1V8STG0_9PEZI|nr:hypothetical protein B0A48_12012 [Cryoendolithus antarcticus]